MQMYFFERGLTECGGYNVNILRKQFGKRGLVFEAPVLLEWLIKYDFLRVLDILYWAYTGLPCQRFELVWFYFTWH